MKLEIYKDGALIEEREITQPMFYSEEDVYMAAYPSGKLWTAFDDEDDFGVTCFDAAVVMLNVDEDKEITKEEFMQHYNKAMKLLLGIKVEK